LLAYTAEWITLQLPWAFLTIVWLNCLIVAGMSLYGRIQRERRAELRLSMDEVRRLAASAERERIGRDLHDLLGHTLSMVALKSELAGRLIHRDPNAAHREMVDVARVSREALSQVRSAVSGIRAAAMAAELASARLLLEAAGVQMEYWHDPQALPGDVETCLALVLREAVTNIQRHARANRVEVTVIVGVDRVVMRIRDDGRGGVNERGNGLTGMRERIVAHGGELWIESPRGKGTGIEIRLPLARIERTTAQKLVPVTAAPLVQSAGSHA
jgi:two-component system sensor histidine kinase DesK